MQAVRRFYQKLGLVLFPLRTWLLLAGVGLGALSVLLIFAEARISQRYLLPSLVLGLWFLFLLSLAYYSETARFPPRPRRWLGALSWSLRNAWIYFLAIMFLLLTFALFYMSVVAFRIALVHH